MADFHRPIGAGYKMPMVLRKPAAQIVMACFAASPAQRKILCDRQKQAFIRAILSNITRIWNALVHVLLELALLLQLTDKGDGFIG
jgi:hypothetical protein